MGIAGGNGSGRVSRRGVLAAAGGIAGIGTVAAYVDASSDAVTVLAAGSLAHTFEEYVGPAFEAKTGTAVHGEYYGTNALMRLIESGTKHPDVVVSADATLLRDRLYGDVTDWDVEFATNSVGLAYRAGTPLGRGIEAGEPWYELARESDPGDLAISDPNLDPLGYRAVQAFELAEAEHDLDGFREDLLDLVYREPEEPQLLAGVDAGSRAGAIAYQNMALDHDLPFQEFPPAYNFSDPELADWYATAEYTTDEEEYTAVGRPVIYNATVTDGASNPASGRDLVRFLTDRPALLADAGLTVSDTLPRPVGAVPDVIRS